MNKIVNINLGGYPFQMDTDAYEYLSAYLGSIHTHFEASEGYDEITGDIEARLAELFQEQLGSRPIVTQKDVQAAVGIMGTPEEFGAESIEDFQTHTRPQKGIKTGKRLFRNPDDKVLGGVCAGLTAYFGIKDPLWVRLILLILTVTSFGFLVLVYIILWVVVPEAATASDRLAMRGETVNVSNIGKIIEEEIEQIPQRFSEAGETISKGFNSQKKNLDGAGAGIRGFFNNIFSLLAQVLRSLLKAIGFLWKPLLIIVSFALAIALIVTWATGAVSFFMSMPIASYILPHAPWLVGLGYTNLFLVIGIPLLALFFLAMRGWTKFRMNNYWRAGLGAFWMLNIFSLLGIGAYTAREFNAGIDVDGLDNSFSIASDTLYLKSSDNLNVDEFIFGNIGNHKLVPLDDQLLVQSVRIDLLKSDDSRFHSFEHYYSRGRNRAEARDLISDVDFRIEKNGNTWTIPTAIRVPKGKKYRAQNVRLTLRIPEGKHVVFDESIDRSIDRFERENWENHWWDRDQHVWTMTAKGLARPETAAERGKVQTYNYVGYTDLQLDGRMKAEIEYSESDIVVDVETRRSRYQDKLEFQELNNTLYVTSNARSSEEMPTLRIKMPQLDYLLAKNTRGVELKGFQQSKMTIDHEGEHGLSAFMSIDSLTLRQTDGSEVEIRGEGKYLKANLKRSELDVERYNVDNANIKGTERSRFIMSVHDTLYQALEPNAKVRYHLEPAVIVRDTL